MNLFQIVFVPFCALAALNTLWRLGQGRTSRLAGLFWFGVWSSGAAVIAYPAITSAVARAFGITRGADLVMYLTVLSLLVITRYFYSRYRQTQNMVTTLVREMAIQRATDAHR